MFIFLPLVNNGWVLGLGSFWRRLVFLGLAVFSVCGGMASDVIPVPNLGAPRSGANLVLTAEEKAWIAQHPVIRLGIDPSWPPFSYLNERQEYQGIDAEFVQVLCNRVGLKMQVVPTSSWSETMVNVREGKVDVLPGTAVTPERELYVVFTEPYLTYVVAIITRAENPFLTRLSDLKGKRVALPKGYVTTTNLLRDYPGVVPVFADRPEDSLILVAAGEADATVENLASASSTIRLRGLTNLKIAGLTDYQFSLRFGVRKDWPELVTILNKALQSLGDDEKEAICDHWIRVEYGSVGIAPWLKRLLLWVGAAGGMLLMGFFFWNWHLSREIVLSRRAEEAQRALNEEKNYFLSVAAHDLNNPLMVISCNLEKLCETGSAKDEAQATLLRKTQEMTDRLIRLIGRILDINAIESGRRSLKLKKLDLRQVVLAEQEVFTEQARIKKIALEVDMPGDPVWVMGDADAIAQILENLMTNALKFSHGGTQVRIRCGVETVGARGGYLAVMDQGPGLTAKDQTLLFQKFTRLSARPTGGETSSGLGLSVVRLLAEAMGGSARGESNPGGGATFTVTLPTGS
jgi:two-component system, NarL family, sensor histidine kinase EvgS